MIFDVNYIPIDRSQRADHEYVLVFSQRPSFREIIPFLSILTFLIKKRILGLTLLNFSQYPIIYTYLESARRELSNDTHIDYVCDYSYFFRFFSHLGIKALFSKF